MIHEWWNKIDSTIKNGDTGHLKRDSWEQQPHKCVFHILNRNLKYN